MIHIEIKIWEALIYRPIKKFTRIRKNINGDEIELGLVNN